jgi:hypothetical protein
VCKSKFLIIHEILISNLKKGEKL